MIFKSKQEKDDKVFDKVKEYLSGIKETLSKVDILIKSSISQESISAMVLNIESSIKVELALILDLVLRLPTNVQCSIHVSQAGYKDAGSGSSKRSGEESGVVVGKFMFM